MFPFMRSLAHRFKHVVTAVLVLTCLPGLLLAQTDRLDRLFAELAEAEAETAERLERQIIAEWGKSGSAAMDLLLRRGKEALDAGDPAIAAEHFTALVDHAPDFAEGYFGRASSYYLLGLTGPALADIETALALNPKHFEAMQGLAIVMEELQRPDDALALYEMALALHPHAKQARAGAERLRLALQGQAL